MTGRARTADILSDTFKSLISSPQTNTVERNSVGGPKPMEHGSVSFEIRISGFEADVDGKGDWKSGQLRLVLVRPNTQTTDSFFDFRKIRTTARQGQDTDSTVHRRLISNEKLSDIFVSSFESNFDQKWLILFWVKDMSSQVAYDMSQFRMFVLLNWCSTGQLWSLTMQLFH